MWSLWVNRKGTTKAMYIAKLKDGPKRAKKTFLIILERVLNGMMEGEKMESHQKVEVFFSSQNIDFPFYLRRLLELFFFFILFSFFLFLFFLCSISWGLGGFDDIWGENHFFKNLFLNGMT
jgi:hypothetical protein